MKITDINLLNVNHMQSGVFFVFIWATRPMGANETIKFYWRQKHVCWLNKNNNNIFYFHSKWEKKEENVYVKFTFMIIIIINVWKFGGNKNLQNCAGITSGSRSSSSNSVAALISLLPLLLYCHRGLDFEYFFFLCCDTAKRVWEPYSRCSHVIVNHMYRRMKIRKRNKTKKRKIF